MSAEKIRCESDIKLANELLELPEVKRINRWIEENEEEKPNTIRRHLLSTSVRLSPELSPKLHEMAEHCRKTLDLELPLELYAYSSPQYNAACFKPEDGRLYIMFSSALLEAFKEKELLYVMGHEIGHHIYSHHDIPIGYLLRGKAKPSADVALKLFAWSRYAEFSADRAGAYCTDDLDSVARALFKLASGLSHLPSNDPDCIIDFNLDEFIKQVDDMVDQDAEPGQGAPIQDWFSTHPFSPLRVKALIHFHRSQLMQDEGFDKNELEFKVSHLMKLMEPSYFEAKTRDTKVMRNVFIAAAIILAKINGEISEKEREVLQQFLGKSFDLDKLDSDLLEDLLPNRIAEAIEATTKSQRMQVIRDLTIVSNADEQNCAMKDKRLKVLAEDLEIPEAFVRQCLGQEYDLD